jgi:exodeoxyribonuclease VII small subunit
MPKKQETTKQDEPLEKTLDRLEKIVERLESGEVGLEKAIDLYEEGRKLGGLCSERLASLERRVEIVIGESDEGLVTEPFEGVDEDN